jgi:hypothetical protein
MLTAFELEIIELDLFSKTNPSCLSDFYTETLFTTTFPNKLHRILSITNILKEACRSPFLLPLNPCEKNRTS